MERGLARGLGDSRFNAERSDARGERGGALQLLHVVPRSAPSDKDRGPERQVSAGRAARFRVAERGIASAGVSFAGISRGSASLGAGLDGDVRARGDAEHSHARLGPAGRCHQEDRDQSSNQAHGPIKLAERISCVNARERNARERSGAAGHAHEPRHAACRGSAERRFLRAPPTSIQLSLNDLSAFSWPRFLRGAAGLADPVVPRAVSVHIEAGATCSRCPAPLEGPVAEPLPRR